MRRRRVVIVGAGRAGLGIAGALRDAGYPLSAVVCRTRASAARARRLLGGEIATYDLAAAVGGAGIVLACVPDGALPGISRSLAGCRVAGSIVLHASGSAPVSVFARLRDRGARIGGLHPLVSFPPPAKGALDLRGAAFAVAGDPQAVRAARAMVAALGGRAIRVPSGSRAAYHLAASMLANNLVALIDAGLDLAARRLRVSERDARRAFMPLVESVVDSVSRRGASAALTGPVARGDLRTVRIHLRALGREAPALGEIYRLLSRRAADIAEARGDLAPATAAAMRRLLGTRRRRD